MFKSLTNNRLVAIISNIVRTQDQAPTSEAKDLAGALEWAENQLASRMEKKFRYGMGFLMLDGKRFHHASIIAHGNVFLELCFKNSERDAQVSLWLPPVTAHALHRLKDEKRQERLNALYEDQKKRDEQEKKAKKR